MFQDYNVAETSNISDDEKVTDTSVSWPLNRQGNVINLLEPGTTVLNEVTILFDTRSSQTPAHLAKLQGLQFHKLSTRISQTSARNSLVELMNS